ncbi:2'-5' RNA ligase family protein [Romeria aff. gracilis LEGE 07310]|uniref:2'-5' RNA ligase family protein n=1 Tax=Vasconcelosia minhoensis LEGE 07310 TaxID=915328 RepID=A0A8J7AI23_9CYAN|nr:2'-5' RNA ligase family protein [Romeria gracilis]MBE9077953.1 2'-5' RNA ligase family protein [Romeria aff. gracilis LEGE 07310]
MQPQDSAEPLSRFFIALVPPQPVQDYANQVKQVFRDRFHSKAAFRSPPHITLQPPFQWPERDRDTLTAALTKFAASQQSLPIMLDGFAAFPPRVIYIDVVKSPELMALKPALMDFTEAQLGLIDKKDRNRPFKPHLTVAFRDLKPAAFRRAWPEFESQPVHFEFMAEALTLLRHSGQRWEVFGQVPLQNSAD